jgi:hypothetical protein
MNDDQDGEKKFQMMPMGDIGTLVIALIFLAGFLWLMFGPSPFAGLYQTAKPAPPQEVTVTLPAKAK